MKLLTRRAEDAEKTAWRDGTTHLVMSPLEFMQRRIEWRLLGGQICDRYGSNGSRLCENSSRCSSRETLTSQIGPGSTIAISARVEGPSELRSSRVFTQPRSTSDSNARELAAGKLTSKLSGRKADDHARQWSARSGSLSRHHVADVHHREDSTRAPHLSSGRNVVRQAARLSSVGERP
jgi:hypothetical protein